jgi:CRP/FNR family cyclic AMP-dependent transcriptional regulator
MNDLLAMTVGLPELHFAAGDTVLAEGGPAAGLWVLVSGALQVSKNGIDINTVAQPGAVVGEISVLLGAPCGATVRATVPSVLRHAADGRALLDSHPAMSRLVAVGLAERLNFVTAYLVDLKQQYGSAPGLSMVADVLRELSQRQATPARPGSARDPDPDD